MGDDTVHRLLKKRRYVLRANRKRLNKRKDSDRDRPMRSLVRTRKQHETAGFPSISVDAKQRELIGNFKIQDARIVVNSWTFWKAIIQVTPTV